MQAKPVSGFRSYAIDIFRALTMLLMIFVNDLWTLRDVPEWLGHVPAKVDGMGLADVVFPAFLFIVGLSIPFALQNRWKRGEANQEIVLHILSRSFALLVMGLCHVNLESYNRELALLTKPVWQILATTAFFLIWLDYPKDGAKTKKYTGQALGWILLLGLVLVYQGGTADNPTWMRVYWWGILGLIGWAYLICSLVFVAFKGNLSAMWTFFAGFMLFSIFSKLGWLDPIRVIKPYVWLIDDGATPALSMAGIIVALYYQPFLGSGKSGRFWMRMGLLAAACLAFGWVSRPLWGIHKIGSSPSWVTICIGISILFFCFLIWLVELKGKKEWFKLIKPAGTSTLTCYLLPYIHYGLLSITGLALPLVWRIGALGIFKSLAYALIIILITGLLERGRIRLKI
jgi:predicted acyltransferase